MTIPKILSPLPHYLANHPLEGIARKSSNVQQKLFIFHMETKKKNH